MYTLFRAIGDVIDTRESLELYPAAEFRAESASFPNSISHPYKQSAPYRYLSFRALLCTFNQKAGININFPWVKSHEWDKGNDRDSALANLGRAPSGNPIRRLGHAPMVSDRGYGNGY